MGFNQCYISTIENLQKELDNVGLIVFVKRYQKYECLTGSSESMLFIENKIKEYEKVIDTRSDELVGDILF
jgi:hypothetical protein